MSCSPQRFLANNRNLLRDAVITASSVLPIENKVVKLDRTPGPQGTAQVQLSGIYTGQEQADYEVKIRDTDVEVARVSAPTRSGAGSGTVGSITASGVQQTFTLECVIASILGAAATAQVEGATVAWAIEGTPGNLGRITVDQSGLVYADTNYSLVRDVQAGQGGQSSPLIGQAFDFDAALLDGQGKIPASAHRIAFAGDRSNIYLQYKAFVEGELRYYTVPALKRDYPKGTRVQFVTGGRTVAVTDGVSTETTTGALPDGVVTAFDFLNWARTESLLLRVRDVVPDDRSPTGLSAREFSLRTDAHAEASTGSGGYAQGFTDVSVAADAGTQSVTATCFAVTSADHPNARLGAELWALKSSLLGDLGIIRTGVLFSGTAFGLRIPVALPPGFGEDKGSIGASINYAARTGIETEPPICVKGLRLGPDATDKAVTFRYSARPTGDDCDCTNMPVPPVNSSCLGNPSEGGNSVSYKSDTNTKLTALRLYIRDLVEELSEYGGDATAVATQAAAVSAPADGDPSVSSHVALQTQSLLQLADTYEATLAQIDVLEDGSPDYRTAGMTAWDAAFARLQADIAATIGATSPPSYYLLNIPSDRYTTALAWALASAGIANVGKADASTVSGDGCWRDYGGSAWWIDVSGIYEPLFTNKRFYFCRKTLDGGVRSTHEATGAIMVECPENLKNGDEVTIKIENASRGSTYQVGDVEDLPIVAASPLALTGGVDAAPTQTWTVTGSVSGPFPSCTFNPDSPAAYLETVGGSTVGFLLAEGGIPTAQGDRHRFAVEGGHYDWRKDDGVWNAASPPLPIPLGADVLDAGLSVSFTAGAASSFVTDDLFAFRALQPWAPSNTSTPNKRVWKWDTATATYAADLGSVQQLDLFAMLCTLPDGASVTLNGGLLAANEWAEPLTVRAGCIWIVLDQTARYISIAFADATGGSLRFPWLGVPLSTTLSADVQVIREYRTNRPGGNLQGGRFVGKTISGSATWTEAALTEADATLLTDMLDWIKERNDEPLLLIPQITRTDDPVIVARVDADQIEFVDHMAYNQNSGVARKVSCTIPLDGELQ